MHAVFFASHISAATPVRIRFLGNPGEFLADFRVMVVSQFEFFLIRRFLRRPPPSLPFDLPDVTTLRERVRKGPGPHDGLTLNRDGESP